ncbi:MAG: hypothetical protein Q7R41_15810 [Phycisphaerales bacterium]|nr:hypothetical protein [Phycisphaerales bacterium]
MTDPDVNMADETRLNPRDEPQTNASNDVPHVEDAAEPEEAPTVGLPDDEAEAAALSLEARALDGGVIEAFPSESVSSEPSRASMAAPTRRLSFDDGTSDTGRITDEPAPAGSISSRFRKGDWEHEFSAHRIAAELSRIEIEVRRLIEDCDPKRKRRFTGTRRWHELEEDLLSLRFTGRVDEDTLRRVFELIARRHFLFGQLRFVASTRPTWNT